MFTKVLYSAALVVAFAGVAHAGQQDKVLICHATSSATNPTVMISVSPNAVEAQLAQGSTLAKQLSDGSYSCTIEVFPQ